MRKTDDTNDLELPNAKLKKYYYSLFRNELYVFKTKDSKQEKSMHSLKGVLFKDCPEEFDSSKNFFHSFQLIFHPNIVRQYYFDCKNAKDKWATLIKQAIGYNSIDDYYTFGEALGEGKFGQVKAAVHKMTGEKVAVKIMTKTGMDVQTIAQMRKEIAILKMC